MKLFGRPLAHLSWKRVEMKHSLSQATGDQTLLAVRRRCPTFRSVKSALVWGLP